MKKLIAFVLACLLLCSAVAGNAASTFDMSVLQGSEILDIDVDSDSEIAFVTSTISVKNKSFSHEGESDNYYSYAEFDMLIIDYFSTSAYPILRLWLYVCSNDDYFYFTSVTFTIDGKDYTFSDIADKDWFYEEIDHKQAMLIKMGTDNIDFFAALENYYESLDDINAASIPVVFHGAKDVKTDLGGDCWFLLDFLVLKSYYLNSNGGDYLDKANSTPLKVK